MSHNQLDMLTDLARDARDQAGKLLAQERQTQQHAMRDGIDPATMYNYQQFLASLDAALVRARQALTAQQKRVQQSQQHWQQEQRKLSSYDTLASRRLLEEHRRQARYEQKATDDFVTSRVARQQSDKPL